MCGWFDFNAARWFREMGWLVGGQE